MKNKIAKVFQKIGELYTKKGKLSIIIMGATLLVTYGISTFLQYYGKISPDVAAEAGKGKLHIEEQLNKSKNYNIANYMEMTSLKDTLEMLMKKGEHLSREDTATFVRLVEKINKLDPTMIQQVMDIKKQQDEMLQEAMREQDEEFNNQPMIPSR